MPRQPRGIRREPAKLGKFEPRQQEIVYIVCPLCGRSRALELSHSTIERKPGKSKRLRWDFFDPETSPIVQIRMGGGKVASDLQPTTFKGKGSGTGFGFRTKQTLTWQQANGNSEFQDQLEAIKEQLERLLRLLKK